MLSSVAKMGAALSVLLVVPIAHAQTAGVQASDGQASPAGSQGDSKRLPATGIDAGEESGGPTALAGSAEPPPPGLIAPWSEIRARLARRGIGLVAGYSSESAYNVTGGRERLFRDSGQIVAGALIDLNKTVGLKGGAFQATLTLNRGHNLSDDAGLGTLQQVQNIYGRGQTLRVTQFWYEQLFSKHVEIKLGLTSPGEDFADFSCQFMNLSFCGAQPGNLIGDYWGNWTVSQMGARVRVSLSDHAYLAAGVYQVNPRNLFARHFYFINVKGGTGVLVPAEVGLVRTDAHGHVASTKFGGWYSNTDANDVLTGVNGRPFAVTGLAPLTRSSRYGVYASLERQLSGRSHNGNAISGVSVFASVTQTDRATALIDNQAIVGLFYSGVVPSLRGSSLGIAIGRTNVNGRVTQSQRLDPSRIVHQRGAEYAFEVYFSLQPLPGLEVRPDVQWVVHPGGVHDAKGIGVLGLKTAFTL